MTSESMTGERSLRGEGERLGQELASVGRSKDALVRLLKRAATFLEGLGQSEEAQQDAEGIARALESSTILKHGDKDVKICCARCFCQVLRIWAPDTPYQSEAVLAEMLGWFLTVFKQLSSPGSPNFEICLSCLGVIAQTKCFLLLLDLEHPSRQPLICDTFRLLLEAISEEGAGRLHDSVFQVLSCMLLEADAISQEQLDTILICLVAPMSDSNPAGFRFVAELLRVTEKGVRPALHKFLVSIVEGRPTGSQLKNQYHTLLHQIYQISPTVMLPILARLAEELSADEPSERVAALELLGKLLAVPGARMDLEQPDLFTEFLKRAADLKAEVRQSFLELAPSLAETLAPKSHKLLLKELTERLLDHDEELRSAAVAAICKTAIRRPEAVELKSLEEVVGRLRDKKLPVRKEAAQQLMALFRAHCSSADDASVLPEERVIWLPGRLCLAACRDPELGSFLLDKVFKAGLLPLSMEALEAVPLWATIYAACSPQEKASIMRLLKMQAAVRTHLQTFVELRGALHEEDLAAKAGGTPPPPNKDADRLRHAISSIARIYPDPAKTADLLHRLRELKDNRIFKQLASLLEPGLEAEAAQKLTKEAIQRVGQSSGNSRNLGDLVRSLCARAFPGALPEPHAIAILERLAENGTDDDCGHNLMQLVVESSAANPHIFALTTAQVARLLEQDDPDLTRTATQILASAGRLIAKHNPKEASEMAPAMEQLCKEGSLKTAKAAVRALANVLDKQGSLPKLTQLCRELTASLSVSDPGVVAKLEAISGIGRIAPDVFAQHVATTIASGLQVLLDTSLENIGNRDVVTSAPIWARHVASDIVKARAVKAVARGFVPDVPISRIPDETLAALPIVESELLRELEHETEDTAGGAVDSDLRKSMGYRRLAAATALLKLGRTYDAKLQMTTFLRLALIMQDNMSQVRAAAAEKLVRLVSILHNQSGGARKASKYAAILALAALDPLDDLRRSAFASLQQYCLNRRAAAEKASRPLLGGGVAMHELPEFLLPFLVQILAHHPDLPTPEDLADDPEPLQHFARMLQFPLQALMLPVGCSSESAAASHSLILKLLRAIKTTEDATPDPQTERVHMMCDLGLLVARTMFEEHFKENGVPDVAKFSGGCPLPVSLYRSLAGKHPGRIRDGSTLPSGYKLRLEASFQPNSGSLRTDAGAQRAKPAISTARRTKPKTQNQTSHAGGLTPFSVKKRAPEKSGPEVTGGSKASKIRFDDTPNTANRTEMRAGSALDERPVEKPSRHRHPLRASSLVELSPVESFQAVRAAADSFAQRELHDSAAPSSRTSPDENEAPAVPQIGDLLNSAHGHLVDNANCRPGWGTSADHAAETREQRFLEQEASCAPAARLPKPAVGTRVSPSKSRKDDWPPEGVEPPTGRETDGTEALLLTPHEDGGAHPLDKPGSEQRKAGGGDATPPPARPQRRTRRDRELDGLLAVAKEMGADTNPHSPRSTRRSASSERRRTSHEPDAPLPPSTADSDPEESAATLLTRPSKSRAAAEADVVKEPSAQQSKAQRQRRGVLKTAPKAAAPAKRGGKRQKRKT